MLTDFQPQDLSNIFSNVNHKPCNVPGFDFAYDIMDNGLFIGEIFYSKSLKEWAVVKDNFPAQRAGYRCDFPVKHIETFIQLMENIKIKLILWKK